MKKWDLQLIAVALFIMALANTFMMGELGARGMAIVNFIACMVILPWIVANND